MKLPGNRNLETLNRYLESLDAKDRLHCTINEFGSKVTLASSLGPQSLVLTHMLSEIISKPDVFFLDTGRLPAETYDLLNRCMEYFGITYRVYFPERSEIEEFMERYGPNGIYHSVVVRKKCCNIRKVASLERALSGYNAWISGVRRDQNESRATTKIVEIDERFKLFKVNPLVDWTQEDVWNYIHRHNIPYNDLHDQGYPSIGCEPCTKPVEGSEDPRAGRWWWEENSDSECGVNQVSTGVSDTLVLKVENNIFENIESSNSSDTRI